MEAVQLFLNINKPGLNNEWNKQIDAALKQLEGAESVMIIEQNESNQAQINISYDVLKLPFNKIEETVKSSGAGITEINIHFPSVVSGTADPYGASVVATTEEDDLESIEGVLGIGVSSLGIIKAELDPLVQDKQKTIEEIIRRASVKKFSKE